MHTYFKKIIHYFYKIYRIPIKIKVNIHRDTFIFKYSYLNCTALSIFLFKVERLSTSHKQHNLPSINHG